MLYITCIFCVSSVPCTPFCTTILDFLPKTVHFSDQINQPQTKRKPLLFFMGSHYLALFDLFGIVFSIFHHNANIYFRTFSVTKRKSTTKRIWLLKCSKNRSRSTTTKTLSTAMKIHSTTTKLRQEKQVAFH